MFWELYCVETFKGSLLEVMVVGSDMAKIYELVF